MNRIDRTVRYWRRKRAIWSRRRRLVFPSPIELKFIEIMGGKVFRFKHLHDPFTKFPAAIVLYRGRILRRQKMRREVQLAGYSVDFANDLHRIIELDGRAWHMDVVADMDREIHIKSRYRDARFLRIKGYEIKNNPAGVRAKTIKFLD